ncbi:MAG: hypothetical protein HY707_00440 [Ignavibacteriae bacterium]|nr:hypothetical protein [Ignavibacteriota bacterium]
MYYQINILNGMSFSEIKRHIARTLLYYEIFDHPLSKDELFYLFPQNSLKADRLYTTLNELTDRGSLITSHGYYSLLNGKDLAKIRLEREHIARRRFIIAKLVAHIIKRFPFVRAIFISGDLSKGVANPKSDIDYVIVTAPNRLWICRTLLVLFKKVFLLNQKKYFCLNYYVDAENLTLDDHNYFTATEIAHLKPLYNLEFYLKYLDANTWIKNYFPNYQNSAFKLYEGNNRPSFIQKVLELFFFGSWVDTLDTFLMTSMIKIWKKRYPQYDNATRERIFRCSKHESRAFVGNFADKVLSLYQQKLTEKNLL